MKVYSIKPTTNYSYGCALIAANTEEEAIKTFKDDDYNQYLYDELKCVCTIVNKLTYECDKPANIIDTVASE